METHQEARCTHRWLLSEPDACRVRGVCRRCGARRTYPSGLELPAGSFGHNEFVENEPVVIVTAPGEKALV